MGPSKRNFTASSKIEAFRLPKQISEAARKKAAEEDITLSQLMRRAIKRELGYANAK